MSKTENLAEPAVKETIELATWPIPLMVENKNKGLFVDLVKEIATRNKKNINITVIPSSKALLGFSSNKYDGYFPANDLSIVKGSLKTAPFYIKTDYIFYRKNRPLATLKDLEGKKIGLTFRYFYDDNIIKNKKIRFEYADDDFINMKKLGRGEIDAFIVEMQSGLQALVVSGFKNIEFDKGSPISAKPIYFAFPSSAQGEALRSLFDKTLEEMKKDGSLNRIFSR